MRLLTHFSQMGFMGQIHFHSKGCLVVIYKFIYKVDSDLVPHSAVGNVSGNRCEFDCRSRGPGI